MLKCWAILTQECDWIWTGCQPAVFQVHVWLLWCDPDVKCGTGLDRMGHSQAGLHVFWQREFFLRKRVSGMNDLDIFQRGITRCVWITQQWKTTTLHQGVPQQVCLYLRSVESSLSPPLFLMTSPTWDAGVPYYLKRASYGQTVSSGSRAVARVSRALVPQPPLFWNQWPGQKDKSERDFLLVNNMAHQHQTSLNQHLSHKYTLSMSLIQKHTSSFPAHTPSICLFVLLSHEWWSLSSSATHSFIYSLSNTHTSALKSASKWRKKTFWPSPGHWWNKGLNYVESFFHFSGQKKNSSHSVDHCQTLHLVLL